MKGWVDIINPSLSIELLKREITRFHEYTLLIYIYIWFVALNYKQSMC